MHKTYIPNSSLTPDIKVIGNLWHYLWPQNDFSIRLRFIISALALLLAKGCALCIPLFFKEVINHLSVKTSMLVVGISIPLMLILGYGLARFLAALLAEVRDGIFSVITQRAVREVGLCVFKHLHNLGLRFHLDRQTGGLSRVIERGVKGIESLLQFLTFNIIPTALEIFMVAALMWGLYDFWYAFVTFLTMLGYIAFTLTITEWRIHFVKTMNEMDNQAHTKSMDSLLNFETVKYFNNEHHEIERFDQALQQYKRAAIRNKYSLSALNVGQAAIITAGLVVIMIMGWKDINYTTFTVGDFVALNTYLMQLYVPLFTLGFAYREVKLSLVNMESLFSLLDVPFEIEDDPKALPIKYKEGDISFEDVYFSYNTDRSILKGVSFHVPAGKTLAVVGASGAGKSTLSRLLFRFYEVSKGRILIDQQDIRSVTQQSVRQLIGIVPQDTVLFNDTIFYNIAYGCPTASQEEIIEAARHAQIHDFIITLPQGYQTQVGERGLKLSGGEKQRVAIARTFLKKPKIFVFDEATSALDTHTEKQIQLSLKKLSENHTTLIIAHRLSTVIEADHIIVLDQGVVAEQGNHKTLLLQNGLYAKLWQKQQKSLSNKEESLAQ